MRTYQHTTFTILDRHDIFNGVHKSDAGVGLGRFSTTLWHVFVIELRDSVVFSVVQTVMEFERFG